MSTKNRTEVETADQVEEKNSRDNRGRWRKGHCPNPKGRPRKNRSSTYDPSDIRHFMNSQVELMVGGEPRHLDRKAALMSKIFESAMKGRVSQQRFLYGIFEKSEAQLSELRQQYHALVSEWIIDNPDFKGLDESLTHHQYHTLITLAATLNHYHPGQFTELLPKKSEADSPVEPAD